MYLCKHNDVFKALIIHVLTHNDVLKSDAAYMHDISMNML